MTASTGPQILCHHDLESPHLREAWTVLERNGIASPFQRLDFVALMTRDVLPSFDAALRVFQIVDTNGTTCMILPMVLRSVGPFKALEAFDLGLSDYVLPLFAETYAPDRAEIDQILSQIGKMVPEADTFSLTKVPETFAERRNPLALLPLKAMGVACHPRPIAGNEAISGFRKSGLHDDFRKRLRKLTREGREPRWHAAQTAEEAEAYFEALVRLRTSRFSALKRSDDLKNAAMHRFYLELARKGCVDGSICLLALFFKDEIVAVQYGLLHQGRCVVIMVGAETEQWRAASPGLVNFVHMVDWCIEQNLQIFDLGVGDHSYKKRFTTEQTALFELHRALSLRGYILAGLRRTRRFARLSLMPYPKLNASVRKLLKK